MSSSNSSAVSVSSSLSSRVMTTGSSISSLAMSDAQWTFSTCLAWSTPVRAAVRPQAHSFCYLGDMLFAGGGCEISVTTRVRTAWKKFRELLPVLTSRHLSYKTRGHVYNSCVRSAMLHASETWPLTKTNLQRLQRNQTDLQYQASGRGHGKVKRIAGKA